MPEKVELASQKAQNVTCMELRRSCSWANLAALQSTKRTRKSRVTRCQVLIVVTVRYVLEVLLLPLISGPLGRDFLRSRILQAKSQSGDNDSPWSEPM